MISKTLSTSKRFGDLHKVAGRLAEFCQSLYPLLVAHADDFGRLSGDAYTVRHAVVPTSPRAEGVVASALSKLHAVGLITWYDAGDQKVIQINNFEAHQGGLSKRTSSRFPSDSEKVTEFPPELNRTQQEPNSTEQNGTDTPALRATFDDFWARYPRKVAKDAALAAWLRLHPGNDLRLRIFAAVTAHAATWNDPKFIPHPATWLRQKRWDDELPEAKVAAVAPVWNCQHLEHCDHREMCALKDANPRKWPRREAVAS